MLNTDNDVLNSDSIFSKIGPELPISTDDNYSITSFSVTSLADGGFWLNQNRSQFGLGSNIYRQRYDANGSPIGIKYSLIITDPDAITSYSITSLVNGEFVVIWRSVSPFSFPGLVSYYGQRFDANNNPIGTQFLVNKNVYPIDYSVAPLGDGGFILISSTPSYRTPPFNTVGQRFDANFNPIGSKFLIYNDGLTGSPATPLDNGFVIVWGTYGGISQDDLANNILGQRYDANFNPIGSKFQINTYTYDKQYHPSVASLADGRFIVTWTSKGQDGSETGIYGQLYDVNANRIGSEFQINTYTNGNQAGSLVTSLADEGFVVTWTSYGQDGSARGIYGQLYDFNANRIGSEFRTNTITNNQSDPSIASLDDGKFVAIWEDRQNIQSLGVFAQIFGSAPQVPSYGIFNLEQLTRSGFIDGLSFNPVEIGGLPVASLYDETFYLNQNSDVATAVNSGVLSNGYTHFVNYGQFEGRDPSILYDEQYYLEHSPDVANAVAVGSFASGFQHYALFGQVEGRNPSAVFNEQAYKNANPDVADAITNGGFISGFEHYLESGQAEGRSPFNFLYNESDYLLQNPDVAEAVISGIFQDGFEHYINFGQTEKRNPSRLFDENQYLELNSDVANAVNADLITSGFEHYILFGRAEGRGI